MKDRLKDHIEIRVRKGVGEQIQTLAARQNIDPDQASEELVRRGLEAYLAEQAGGTDAAARKDQQFNREA